MSTDDATYWNERVGRVEPTRDGQPLRWWYGPAKADPNPRQKWCHDCYGVVDEGDGRRWCRLCKASQPLFDEVSSGMPPVPCPDCMHPTTYDEDAFVCSSCGQAFVHPHGMVLSQWRELWQAWTAGRTVVQLPEPDGTSYEGDPIWGAHVDYEDVIFACVKDGQPVVDGPIGEEPLPAEIAELFGRRLLAAAREARRLATQPGAEAT